MIKVGDLVTIPYLYSDGEHGPGVVLAVDEEKTRSKKIFTLWSSPENGEPIKEWVDDSILKVISKKEDK